MDGRVEVQRSGVGTPTVLFLIFLVLKLTGAIRWSWWWVTAPLWIGWGLSLIFLIVVLGVVGVVGRRG